jgi:hypothetical protein
LRGVQKKTQRLRGWQKGLVGNKQGGHIEDQQLTIYSGRLLLSAFLICRKGLEMNQVSVVMPFDGKEVLTVRDQEGKVWISVKRICENIGVDWANQWVKIRADQRFNCCGITIVAEDGKQREMFCIPLEQLNGWLFTINANKVRSDVKPRLIAYQKECMDALYKHFMPRGEQDLSGFMATLSGLETKIDAMRKDTNEKLDYIIGVEDLAFGDLAPVVKDLINQVAAKYNMSRKAVWGLGRKQCDISSYQKGTEKLVSFYKRLLIGMESVKDEKGAK